MQLLYQTDIPTPSSLRHQNGARVYWTTCRGRYMLSILTSAQTPLCFLKLNVQLIPAEGLVMTNTRCPLFEYRCP